MVFVANALTNAIWIYGLFALCGFMLQTFLHGGIRIVIYPLSVLLGIFSGWTNSYYLIAFNLGMISRAALGQYWSCVAVEALCMISGFLIGFFVL